MKYLSSNTFRRPRITAALIGSLLPLAASPLLVAADDDDEVFELSPFTIDASSDTGYRATSTLAGTRLRTDLKDIGSAISVITQEFLEDTGATNVQDLLVYTTSTEVGGALGNFAGGETGGGARPNLDGVRENPDGNNRVRGQSAATSTRDFFISDFGFDGYNTDRVTVSRGPNSILYGVGSPGGVIDSSLKRAMLAKDKNQLSLRFGQRGSVRATLDFNRVLAEDRLAVRIAVMDETLKFRQNPAYEDDTRVFGTLTAKLFKNENVEWLDATMFRASAENAQIESTPVNPLSMSSNMHTWFGPPTTPEIDAITGLDYAQRDTYASPGYVYDNAHPGNLEGTPGDSQRRAPEFYRMWGVMWSDPFAADPNIGFPAGSGWEGAQGLIGSVGKVLLPDGTYSKNGWGMEATRNSFGAGVAPGFSPYSVPISALDFENLLLAGHTQNVSQDYDAYNFALEQSFFNNKLGVELVVDHQEKFSTSTFPFGNGRNSDVAIDVGLYATNGQPNPNVGRPVMTALNIGAHNDNWSTRDNQRATAYYDLDFTENDGWARHFGRHTFTGLLNSSERDTRYEGYRYGFSSDDPNVDFARDINSNIGAWNANYVALVYVGDDQRGATSIDDIRLYNDYIRIEVPEVGETFDLYTYDRTIGPNGDPIGIQRGTVKTTEFLNGGNIGRELIDSEALTLQSRFLGGALVTTYGWREDKVKTYDRLNNAKNPDGSYRMDNLDTLDSVATLDVAGQTTTAQAVLHVPSRWTEGLPLRPQFSIHAAESENFQPGSVRRNVYNEVLGFPTGSTKEIGFSVDLMEGKANMRFNWYKTNIVGLKDDSVPIGQAAGNWPANGWLNRWSNAHNNAEFSFDDIGWDTNADYSDGNGGTIPYDQRDPALYNPAARGRYNSFEEVYAAIGGLLPAVTAAEMNVVRSGSAAAGDVTFTRDGNIDGLIATADNAAEGFEFEAIYNPTKNWRILFNAASQETVQSNTGPAAIPFINDVTQAIKDAGLWDMYDTPLTETATFGGRWTSVILTPLAAAAAKEGTVSQEQRKWRWNAVTNYSFSEGRLKGFSAGAAMRWQDEVATGYPLTMDDLGNLVPVLDQAFMGGSQLNGDLWFSYKLKLKDKIDWKVQLNLTNSLGDHDLIPVITNPDGTVATYRASAEKRWFLTNTFSF